MTRATERWTFTDPATGQSWTMPINPNKMSSPHEGKNLRTAYGTRGGTDRLRTFKSAPSIVSWEWGGVIRSKEHYEQLLAWAQKGTEILISDHFGRTFGIVVESFHPEDRRPTPATPWRLNYTMRAMILRRVS